MASIQNELEDRILEIGTGIIDEAKKDKKSSVEDQIFETCMKDPSTKTQILRFIDVLPNLKKNKDVISHLEEYLLNKKIDLGFLEKGVKLIDYIPKLITVPVIKYFAKRMAKNFIAGGNIKETSKIVNKLSKQGMEFSIDTLGEKTTSEKDAESYMQSYFNTFDVLSNNFGINSKDENGKPKINVSIKISSLYSRFDPIDPRGTSESVKNRLRKVFRKAKEVGAFVNIDTEHYEIKNLTGDIFKELLSEDEFKNFNDAGIVVQAYLKDSKKTLEDFIGWSKKNEHPFTVRLVKGAYWDHEVMLAQKNGWEIPVFTDKAQSDENYENLTKILLENNKHIHAAIASHNIRSVAKSLALKEKYNISDKNFEIQMLHGMGKEIKQALVKKEIPLRVYTPFGDLISGMGYFVRRLLENSSNESFLRSFDQNADPKILLKNPKEAYKLIKTKSEDENDFKNIPAGDFSKERNRESMKDALEKTMSFEKNYNLYIGGKWIETKEHIESRNPSKTSEIVGKVSKGRTEHMKSALIEAKKSSEKWKETSVEKRAGYLFNVAEQMIRKRHDLASLITLEAGKNWKEADGDVAEAIDFLNFYGTEMINIGERKLTQHILGEENTTNYIPKGVVGVIAPWNFPLAILTGMTSAALVTGNTVIMKPAKDTPIIAGELMKMFEKAGLPDGVLNYVPGFGNEIGKVLVESPDVNMIAFTGSREVGLDIHENLSRISPEQDHVQTSVLEMGGKNGIIVDKTADFDEAIPGILYSAFGYQGQKCSACSRVLVLDSIYDSFTERLTESAKSLKVGDTRLASTDVGPIINKGSFQKIIDYIDTSQSQGGIPLLLGKQNSSDGFYIGPTIIEVGGENILAKEEVFGPVLAVMKTKDFDESIKILNNTDYALTGGIYTRTPSHIDQFRQEANVGNRYYNRGITGAIVERQPFGGFKMSGAGSKAGCRDYLLEFMYAVSDSVNTARSGHIPGIENISKYKNL